MLPIARLAAEVLGGEPDEHVLDLVEQAAGSPFLLVETLLGLREEDRIRVVDGRAEVLDGRLPDRVRSGMRERLGRLSRPANEAVTVAASLGRTFTFAELAETLGWQPSALLGPVAELLEANLLVERGERLAFWHDITRGAVRESIAASARRALDRWAAEVLLRSGALPVEVAMQLAASAEPGDEVAVATLLDAAKTLIATDSGTAAEFGRRALEISPSHHPLRGEIVSTTAIALHIAGNSDDAIAFADRALRETFPPAQEAEVRLSIAGMFAISPEIRISAGRLALGLPEIPDVLRARHLACLYHNLVTSGRPDEARAMQAAAEAAIAPSRRRPSQLHAAPRRKRGRVRGGRLRSREGARRTRRSRRYRRRRRPAPPSRPHVARRDPQRPGRLHGCVRCRRRRDRGSEARPPGLGLPDVRDLAGPPAVPVGSAGGGALDA